MSSPTHTPGPWSLNFATVAGVTVNFHVTASPMGSVDPICYSPTMSPRKVSQIEANARLIAAAPELLALAQDFSRLMEDDATRAKVDASLLGAFDCYAKNARAAIFKATA